MTLRRQCLRACASGVLAWVLTQAGFWVCRSIYRNGGWLIYERVMRLAFWPNYLIYHIYTPSLTVRASALKWPLLCTIALVGWSVLGALLGVIVHGVLRWCRPRPIRPPPLPVDPG